MTDQICARIETRLTEIDQQMTALRDALAALDNGDRPGHTRMGAVADHDQRVRTRRQRPATPKHVILSGALERLLAEKAGQTSTALADHAKADRKQVLTLLKGLQARGKARRDGQGRGTRWYPYTDEDRIAERTAERQAQRRALAARRNAGSEGDASGTSSLARRVAGLLRGR